MCGEWIMKNVLTLPNLLLLMFMALELAPTKRPDAPGHKLLFLVFCIELFYLAHLFLAKKKQQGETVADLVSLLFGVLFVWELSTTKLNLLDKMLYPTPGTIIALFAEDLPVLLKGVVSSLQLLLSGYFLALATAIPLALLIGWRKRLFNAVSPVTKVLGPIPPIVYIPYAIAILPTFKISSIFIIFVGAFWPIFINTLNGVFNVDKKIVESAKVLNVSERTMLFSIILPATIPAIISGANIGLVLSFILLTAAEMIGATSGLGWYVKYFSDFADYPRVIVGIVFIGMVVTCITLLVDRAEERLLRWRK